MPDGDNNEGPLQPDDTALLLRRPEARGLRFALEFEKADLKLRDWGVRSTVIVFGSSRCVSPEAAAALPPQERDEHVARQLGWYQAAREFARIASERGGALGQAGRWRDNVIATGGGPGIMEAANRGAVEAGAPSIGFNILLPHAQAENRYVTPELQFAFHYFAMRKLHLAMRANALVVFPGGYGTLDELFEILNLQETHKAPARPIVMFDRGYWQKLIDFDLLVRERMVPADSLSLFEFADTPEEAWQSLVRRGLAL